MRSGALARSLLIAVSTLGALGAGELIVRSLPPEVLGYEFLNGNFIRPREFTKGTIRNSLRVHDREPKAKQRGVRRILLLGDSYVAAVSVSIPQGVARRLDEHLATHPEIGSVDVVSLSKEGWGQRDELAALNRLGKRLDPDLVLLLFTSRNDVYNNATELVAKRHTQRELSEARSGGRAVPTFIPAESSVGLWFPGSALNQLIAHRLTLGSLATEAPLPVQFEAFAPSKTDEWQSAWDETEELLLKLRRSASALGADFAVAAASTPEGILSPEVGAARLRNAHPDFAATEFDPDLPDRRLAEICAEHGIPFTALQPELRLLFAQQNEPLHWQYDGHWNVAGNDAAARLLAAFAAEQLGPATARRTAR